ncbi:aldo/keto reductase [Tropicimonas isoalkanivorans]|uniref:Predicted oxidoreductase n=1 Tax=Tropicimonas isoalkanivorans TaxID=441112 RepID=A0A1I1JNQ7_9RHOB|nr:aldo/keto reductase [Tropicimonas isoalkanivorans]SFC50174.1 Predicted oxidoreductase [Tropicimonas isoalkanivorans]
MKTRRIGRDGPDVSALGVGAMSFSDFYGPTDEATSHAILEAAMEHGVSHIDTSNVYGSGTSERVIGSFLAARGSEAREFFHIATKAGIAAGAGGGSGERRIDNSKAYLAAELEASLKRLGVDCVDLFYVHRREAERPIEEVTESLVELVRAGKTRAFGFSEIAPSSLRRAASVHPLAAVQSEYSLSTRAPELGLVQACAELGTTLVAFSPVGRGLLTDRPPTEAAVERVPFLEANPRFQEPNFSANIAATDGFRRLAAEMGHPAAALAIAWLLSRGDHVLPIPGTRSVGHFEELVLGVQIPLSPEDLRRIEEALPVGWAHGDRYNVSQWVGPERYC